MGRESSWPREAAALLSCLASVAILFALATRREERNLLGPVGQDLADGLIGSLGVLAWGAAGALALASGVALVWRLGPLRIRHGLWALVALSGVAILLDRFGRAAYGRDTWLAGWVGAELAGQLAPFVGPLGTALVGVAAVLVPMLALFRFSIRGALWDAADGIRFAAFAIGRWGAKGARAAARSLAPDPEGRLVWAQGRKPAIAEPEPSTRAKKGTKARATPESASGAPAADGAPKGRGRYRTAPPGRAPSGASKDGDQAPAGPPESAEPLVLPREPMLEVPPVITESDDELAAVDRALFGEPEAASKSAAAGIAPQSSAPGAPSGGSRARSARKQAAKTEAQPPKVGEVEPIFADGAVEAVEVIESSSEGPVILERRPTEAPPERSKTVKVKAESDRKTYELPPLHLLDYEGDGAEPVDGSELKGRATRLEQKLRTYGVEGKVAAIRPGPVVTTYEYQPAPGVKVSKIANLADDIAMSMEAVRVRIVAPIPGRGVVGIELPNDTRENVYLKELVAHDRFRKSKGLLTLAMGKDVEGDVQVRDLQKMPHLLIAGTTGSGKSVSINTMILSILYKATPDQVKFIMVDPKMLELSLYNDIPHLLLPVVTDPRKASRALQWTVDEMERRYQLLSDLKVRDIDGFNNKLAKLREARKSGDTEPRGEEPPKFKDPWPGQDLPDPMPYIVVLIDEFADLMCVAPRDVEASVQRLAQKARAAGIHVLLATQRPSTDVITGVIKNNFPSRVSFRVASRHDSSTVLNSPGAENLLGRGDSLFLSVASPMAERIHGGFVSEEEVERVVEFWKKQARPEYDPSILQPKDDDGPADLDKEDVDEHYDMAVKIVAESRRASISGLQRRLRVGYNRAARMIEMMEQEGIVGPAVGAKGEREVLVPPPPED
ncbi:MAG TPA: DNA translocase FtsK 4TM domain-containing protein [Myxococcales bacterium LLY-WYZ-16_1]|nr:DNA translocase FtsK 4TM domain-containing protein [Myxococcales bacterium LLY-WYZ-16_1]